MGVYLFTPAVFESVKAITPSARGELEITDAIQHMIDRGLRVEPHIVTGWWKDTGKLDDMLEANRLILSTIERDVRGDLLDSTVEGAVQVGEGSVLERCTVRGPVVIGRDCRLSDTFIGPYTSISDGVAGGARRDRALHHPREQPHLPPGGAHDRQPHRSRLRDRAQRRRGRSPTASWSATRRQIGIL